MSYERLAKPPHVTEYVPITSIDELGVGTNVPVVTPDVRLYTEEVMAWRGVIRDTESREVAVNLAQNLARDLREQIGLRMGFFGILTSGHVTPEQYKGAINWQARSATLVGFSQLMRDPAILHMLQGISPGKGSGNRPVRTFLIDVADKELPKTGIHVDSATVEDFGLGDIAVGQERWFEGENIFVRAARPAELSMNLMQQYKHRRGKTIDRVALTSLTARVKMDHWTRHN